MTSNERVAAGGVMCIAIMAGASAAFAAQGPYQATGFKVGEVTSDSAIVWTRLTLRPQPNPADAPFFEIKYAPAEPTAAKKKGKTKAADGDVATGGRIIGIEYPPGVTVDDIQHAAPGAPGQVRVLYRPAGAADWKTTAWYPVDVHRDCTRQIHLSALRPGTQYELRVESRASDSADPGQSLDGGFLTAARADQPQRVVFTVSTGQQFYHQDLPGGYKIYGQMLKLEPSFFAHTGDILYYDRQAKTLDLARYHWQRMYSRDTNVAFHRQVASYFEKDDHDAWQNDCWPTMKNDKMFEFTFEQGLAVFREQVPMGPLTYRTYRWGKDLQVWFTEGRDYRSANTDPDGPGKTIWGAEQKAWFKKTVAESDATFKVLISPTPVVGPDRSNKHDNHSNDAFTYEGDELRAFIAGQKNLVVVCGDRHWQYMSVHPTTGVREYSCGPASDVHAGGWSQEDFVPEYHKYLNVIGGFLAATVDRVGGAPTLTFRWYDVDGNVKYEDVLKAE